ncbi:beta-N-acetylhexosaminidase [Tumebacillus sp. BK434]|uniref:beta-N-acetylhexosaminidase n=1 Tax=Tumebacillus sp. BK434 TaxID=2512169 RepID=UPI0010D73078|nr:beta-N-acetylhexosaminidase [Tumebacillus sp. BK434]TCP59231.1 beta-N-acetylhexosaminidase [Tumebacillus sp. BK434]
MAAKERTLRQKIGQTMMFGFHGTDPTPEITTLIRDHHVGGVILFARNIAEPKEVLRLTVALQKIAYEAGHELPLLISIDQENGIVRRLGAGTTLLPGNMALGAAGDTSLVKATAEATGRELKALGINYNLAPVLDVNNNPHNPVIGVRSYGEDPQFVAACAAAAIHGFQEAGVATCGKHFPGHGDTSKDSHLTLPMIPHRRERLEQVELVPFVKAIAEGVDSMMIAHVCFPEIEPDRSLPATLSRRVVTDLLRDELGFEGVITTDCMEMKAIADSPGTVEGTYRAFQAGIDLLFISHTCEWQLGAIERLAAGLEAGDTPLERLEEAYGRIRKLKQKYLSWDEITPYFAQQDPEPDALVGGAEHERLARVTLTKNEAGLLPLTVSTDQTIAVVCLTNTMTSLVEDERYLINPLQRAVEAAHGNTRCLEVNNPPTASDIEQVLGQLTGCAAVIIGTMNAHLAPGQAELVNRLNGSGLPLVVISMRTPYDLAVFPEVATHIAAYEFTPAALEIAVEAVFGKRELQGRLPVTIPGAAARGHRAHSRGEGR